jgi:hypothetical protein
MNDELEQLRRRVELGSDDELDRWRVKSAERREARKDMSNEIDTNAWASWTQDQIQRYFEQAVVPEWSGALTQTRSEIQQDLMTRIHALEVQIAEMRGELKGLREAHRDNVVELPRAAWKSNAA